MQTSKQNKQESSIAQGLDYGHIASVSVTIFLMTRVIHSFLLIPASPAEGYCLTLHMNQHELIFTKVSNIKVPSAT